MIKGRIGDIALMGLSDVNLRRLGEGQPILVNVEDFTPPGRDAPQKVCVFYATREALIEIADTLQIDQVELLDMLGEG